MYVILLLPLLMSISHIFLFIQGNLPLNLLVPFDDPISINYPSGVEKKEEELTEQVSRVFRKPSAMYYCFDGRGV